MDLFCYMCHIYLLAVQAVKGPCKAEDGVLEVRQVKDSYTSVKLLSANAALVTCRLSS